MNSIDELLTSNGFSQTHSVSHGVSINHLIPERQRCGIYVLHFPNDIYYVGQSKDVTKRYAQHRKNHNRIEKISFKRVKQEKHLLDNEEIRMIRLLEASGIPLLNIVHTSITYRSSDFDIVMPPEQQKRWISDLSWEDTVGERINNLEIRRKYTSRYRNQFTKMPFAQDTIRVLRSYIRNSIPSVKQGESEYWACSCLPRSTVYYRININWQEVLTAYDQDGTLFFSFHLALSPLKCASSLKTLFAEYPLLSVMPEETFEEDERIGDFIADILDENPEFEISSEHTKELRQTLFEVFDKHPDIFMQNHTYEPGGQDQIRCIVEGAEAALALIKDPQFLQGMRLCNLELMKKGRCNWAKNHCYDLADNIF